MADRLELKQAKTALKEIIAELEKHWIVIGTAIAAYQRNFQRWKELQKLDHGLPERTTEHDKCVQEWRRLSASQDQRLPELRKLASEAREVVQNCDFWFIEGGGQIERFEQIYDLWEFPSAPEELDEVRRFVANLKKLLSDTYRKLSKLSSEAHDDDGEPVGRVVGSGQSATTGVRARGLQMSRKRIGFCDKLRGEIAKVVLELESYTDLPALKEKFPDLQLWVELSEKEQEDLLNTEREKVSPVALANKYTLRHFGLKSKSTLKRDRRILLREAENL